MVRRTLSVVVFVALAWAGPVFSQCADPSNILSSNLCGFDTAVSIDAATGWWNMVPELAGDPLWGSVAHSASGGRTTPHPLVRAFVNRDVGFSALLPSCDDVVTNSCRTGLQAAV